jgi:hypothetical protein
MDPNAALERYWQAVLDADRDEAAEAYNALRAWLERGGFEPDWTQYGYHHAGTNTEGGYSRAAFFRAPHLRGEFGAFVIGPFDNIIRDRKIHASRVAERLDMDFPGEGAALVRKYAAIVTTGWAASSSPGAVADTIESIEQGKRARGKSRKLGHKGTPLGVQVAKLILAGDVQAARHLAGTRRSWTVPEANAMIAAIRVANKRYGASISFDEFMGGSGAGGRAREPSSIARPRTGGQRKTYEVVVGGTDRVFATDDLAEARAAFKGRSADENVRLMRDGVIVDEHRSRSVRS